MRRFDLQKDPEINRLAAQILVTGETKGLLSIDTCPDYGTVRELMYQAEGHLFVVATVSGLERRGSSIALYTKLNTVPHPSEPYRPIFPDEGSTGEIIDIQGKLVRLTRRVCFWSDKPSDWEARYTAQQCETHLSCR